MPTYYDTVCVDPDCAEWLQELGLSTVGGLLECLGDQVVAWSRSSDTIRVQAGRQTRWVYVKRYHYSTRARQMRGLLRGVFLGASRARREYVTLQAMRSAGVPAVRPIAYGERWHLLLLHSCALVTEGIPNGQSLMRLLRGALADVGVAEVTRARRRLTRALAEQIRAMHQMGYAHGALFWRNVVVRPLDDGSYACHFLDPSGRGRMGRRGPGGRKAVCDIAALAAMAPGLLTRTECLRFAKWYLATDRLDAATRRWITRVLKMSARYRDHELYRWRLEAQRDGRQESTPPAVCKAKVAAGWFVQ
ncbi:MAG TPA: lipopolysaccharide kinase InaA family protein [Phycisphaerae bacterium]|nr:lipopolysaccharide kinase InaA family protein [Phycisphaerae bacterium]